MRAEANVVADILRNWGAHPDFHIRRNNSGGLFDRHGRLVRFGLPGSGDLEGFIAPRARFFTVECKVSTGELRERQEYYQEMVRRRGGVVLIARSEVQFAHEMKAALEVEHEITRRLTEVLA